MKIRKVNSSKRRGIAPNVMVEIKPQMGSAVSLWPLHLKYANHLSLFATSSGGEA